MCISKVPEYKTTTAFVLCKNKVFHDLNTINNYCTNLQIILKLHYLKKEPAKLL